MSVVGYWFLGFELRRLFSPPFLPSGDEVKSSVYWTKVVTIAALLLAAVAVLISAGNFVVSEVRNANDAAQYLSARGRLGELHLAMESYHEKYGHYPPAIVLNELGEPAHSWRVLLLEFLEPEVYQQYRFDEIWNSPHNMRLEQHMPSCFKSQAGQKSQVTPFVVVQGAETAFPYDDNTSFGDIGTRASSVALVVEYAASDIHWMEPRDLDIRSFPPTASLIYTPLSTRRTIGPLVVMADGNRVTLKGSDVIYPLLSIGDTIVPEDQTPSSSEGRRPGAD